MGRRQDAYSVYNFSIIKLAHQPRRRGTEAYFILYCCWFSMALCLRIIKKYCDTFFSVTLVDFVRCQINHFLFITINHGNMINRLKIIYFCLVSHYSHVIFTRFCSIQTDVFTSARIEYEHYIYWKLGQYIYLCNSIQLFRGKLTSEQSICVQANCRIYKIILLSACPANVFQLRYSARIFIHIWSVDMPFSKFKSEFIYPKMRHFRG